MQVFRRLLAAVFILLAQSGAFAQVGPNMALDAHNAARATVEADGGLQLFAQRVLDAMERGDPDAPKLLETLRLSIITSGQMFEEFMEESIRGNTPYPRDTSVDQDFDESSVQGEYSLDSIEEEYSLEDYLLEMGVPDPEMVLELAQGLAGRLREDPRFGPHNYEVTTDAPLPVSASCAACTEAADALNRVRFEIHRLAVARHKGELASATETLAALAREQSLIAALLRCEAACTPPQDDTETVVAEPTLGDEFDAEMAAAEAERAALIPENQLLPTLDVGKQQVYSACFVYPHERVCQVFNGSQSVTCRALVDRFADACVAAMGRALEGTREGACAAQCQFRAAEARLSESLLPLVHSRLSLAEAIEFDAALRDQREAAAAHERARTPAERKSAEGALAAAAADMGMLQQAIDIARDYWEPGAPNRAGVFLQTCRAADISAFAYQCEIACNSTAPTAAPPECRGGVAASLLPGYDAVGFGLLGPPPQ